MIKDIKSCTDITSKSVKYININKMTGISYTKIYFMAQSKKGVRR